MIGLNDVVDLWSTLASLDGWRRHAAVYLFGGMVGAAWGLVAAGHGYAAWRRLVLACVPAALVFTLLPTNWVIAFHHFRITDNQLSVYLADAISSAKHPLASSMGGTLLVSALQKGKPSTVVHREATAFHSHLAVLATGGVLLLLAAANDLVYQSRFIRFIYAHLSNGTHHGHAWYPGISDYAGILREALACASFDGYFVEYQVPRVPTVLVVTRYLVTVLAALAAGSVLLRRFERLWLWVRRAAFGAVLGVVAWILGWIAWARDSVFRLEVAHMQLLLGQLAAAAVALWMLLGIAFVFAAVAYRKLQPPGVLLCLLGLAGAVSCMGYSISSVLKQAFFYHHARVEPLARLIADMGFIGMATIAVGIATAGMAKPQQGNSWVTWFAWGFVTIGAAAVGLSGSSSPSFFGFAD